MRREKAGRILDLIGMLSDDLIDEAAMTETKGAYRRLTGSKRPMVFEKLRFAGAACLCLVLAGGILWSVKSQERTMPEGEDVAGASGMAAEEGGAILAGGGDNGGEERQIHFDGVRYMTAGQALQEELPEGSRLLGQLTYGEEPAGAGLETDREELAGTKVYGIWTEKEGGEWRLYLETPKGYEAYRPVQE